MPRKYLWMTRRRTCDRPRPEEEEILQIQRLRDEPLFFCIKKTTGSAGGSKKL